MIAVASSGEDGCVHGSTSKKGWTSTAFTTVIVSIFIDPEMNDTEFTVMRSSALGWRCRVVVAVFEVLKKRRWNQKKKNESGKKETKRMWIWKRKKYVRNSLLRIFVHLIFEGFCFCCFSWSMIGKLILKTLKASECSGGGRSSTSTVSGAAAAAAATNCCSQTYLRECQAIRQDHQTSWGEGQTWWVLQQ